MKVGISLALLCAALAPTAHAFAPVALNGRVLKGRDCGPLCAAPETAVEAPQAKAAPEAQGKKEPRGRKEETEGKKEEAHTKKKKKQRPDKAQRQKQKGRKEAPGQPKKGTKGTQTNPPKQGKQKNAAKGKEGKARTPPQMQKKKRKKGAAKGRSPKGQSPRTALADLELGSTVSGTVVGVSAFGVFVNIGLPAAVGAALLHISQISDEKIEDVRARFKVGDRVEGARVITVNLPKGEVGLSLRPRRPQRKEITELRVGAEVEGKVVQVVSYGVFVDVGTKVNALLHVSRITGGVVENVRHHLNEGDPVSVHVISTDLKKKTVAVSMLDKKADQYLDKRMSQRQKRFDGTADARSTGVQEAARTKADRCELEYFDQAIKELEDALQRREQGEAA